MLSELRQDHADFALLLDAAAREADLICGGGQPNLALLKDIVSYFRHYLDQNHHAKENLVYGLLMQHMPGFGSKRLPVLDEHLHLAEGTARFERALEDCSLDKSPERETLCQEARAFIKHERDHMQAEEDLILSAAAQWLQPEHWAEVGRVVTAKQEGELEALRSLRDRLLRTIKTPASSA